MLKYVEWSSSGATFTGISSDTQYSVGHVKFPIGLAGIPWATFGADVIGGDSSWCPGLMPLRTLSQLHCVLCCGWYPNGDGILAVWHGNNWKPQHLYLTDTGHYMLRVDGFGSSQNTRSGVEKTIKDLGRMLPKKKTAAEFHAEKAAPSEEPSSVFR